MAKKLKPIILSVKRSVFREDDPYSDLGDKQFIEMRKQALARDKNTCVYCGFTSSKYMDVHHCDDDHHNNELNNLDTACHLCHMCFHLGYAGQLSIGELGYFGSDNLMSQAEINNIVRLLMIAHFSASSNDNKKRIEDFYRDIFSFALDSADSDSILGSTDPCFLANELVRLDDQKYDDRKNFLKNVRFIPSIINPSMSEQLKFFAENKDWLKNSQSFASKKIEEWISASLGKKEVTNQDKYDFLQDPLSFFKK